MFKIKIVKMDSFRSEDRNISHSNNMLRLIIDVSKLDFKSIKKILRDKDVAVIEKQNKNKKTLGGRVEIKISHISK